MNILHLIDLTSAQEESILCCRLALEAAAEHRVVGFGNSADVARAEVLGLRICDLVPPMSPFADAAGARLRRLLAERDGRNASRPWADVVQCWSVSMLGLARAGSGKRTPPRVGALLRPRPPTDLLHGGPWRTLREIAALHDATLFAFDPAVRSSWAGAVSARRGGTLLEHNVRLLTSPASRAGPGDRFDRAAARTALGLHPDEFVITLLADPPDAADAARFAFTLGLLYTTGVRVVGLIPRGTGLQRRALAFVRAHGRRWGLLPFDGPLTAAVAASDATLWDCPDPDGLQTSAGPGLIAFARAAGIPVAAANHPAARRALGPRADICLARDRSSSALADRLLHFISIRHQQPLEPAFLAPPGDYISDLLALWGERANVPVIRPGLPTPTDLLQPA